MATLTRSISRSPTLSGDLDRLLDPGVLHDPFPLLSRLREEAPVAFSEALGMWIVTPYELVRRVLHAPETFSNFGFERRVMAGHPPDWLAGLAEIERVLTTQNLLNSDDPFHRRIRRQANRAFTHTAIAALEPFVRRVINELLDARIDRGRVDFMADIATPLPLIVIAEVMGIPSEDRDRFKAWSEAIVAVLDPGASDGAVLARGDEAFGEFRRYLQAVIAERRHRPDDDLVSRLLEAESPREGLTDAEIVDTCIVFLTAGHESSTGLLGNVVHALLSHPDQLDAARREPALIPGAIEETLRWNPANKRAKRVARVDTNLGGAKIRRGDAVLAMIAAANRDPALVDDPDRFDIQRPRCPHLGFGAGIHFCIGAGLARLEARVTLSEMLRRLPALRLADEGWEPRWTPSVLLRTLSSLPLRFDPPGRRAAS